MFIGELSDFQCNRRKLSKQLCSPTPINKNFCFQSQKKFNGPSSFESNHKNDLCDTQEPDQLLQRADSEITTTNTISVVSTFGEEEESTKLFAKSVIEEETKQNTDESNLNNMKSPHCFIPQCNEIKAIIERASPKSNSYSKFIVHTYSSFAYFNKANLQEPTKQDILAKSLNMPLKSSKLGKHLIKARKPLYST